MIETLKNEKKRRKKRVQLNLIKKKEEKSQFFNSSKVQAIKNFQTLKKREAFQKKQNITKKQAQFVINKVLKEKVKQKQFLVVVEKRKLKEKALRAKAIEKKTQNELNFVVTRSRQLIVRLKLSRTRSIERRDEQNQAVNIEERKMKKMKKKNIILITFKSKQMRRSKKFVS